MSRVKKIAIGSVCFAVAVFAAPQAHAIELITNGGFELPAPNGGFNGWLRTQQTGSVGSFVIDVPGTTTPGGNASLQFDTAANTLTPGGGTAYALSTPVSGNNIGPATHVLYQDVVVPAGIVGATLRFQMFVGDPNNTGFVADSVNRNQRLTYDDSSGANQFGRVDLLFGGRDIFSTAAADRVMTTPNPLYFDVDQNMGNPSPWVQYSFNLTSNLSAGGNFRLRFATVSNINPILMGVDNVSLDVTPSNLPEVSSAWLLLLALPLLLRRRKESVE